MLNRSKYIDMLKVDYGINELANMNDEQLLSKFTETYYTVDTLIEHGLHVNENEILPVFNKISHILNCHGLTPSGSKVLFNDKPVNKTWLRTYRHDLYTLVQTYESLYYIKTSMSI